MGEEDGETAKSESRLGMKCIVHRVFTWVCPGLGNSNKETFTWSRHYCSVCFLMLMTLCMHVHIVVRYRL